MQKFEWHEEKAKGNVDKHGITFEEAKTTFADVRQLKVYDEVHSLIEERWCLIGESVLGRVLLTVYTKREDDSIRIISSRLASKKERSGYESYRI